MKIVSVFILLVVGHVSSLPNPKIRYVNVEKRESAVLDYSAPKPGCNATNQQNGVRIDCTLSIGEPVAEKVSLSMGISYESEIPRNLCSELNSLFGENQDGEYCMSVTPGVKNETALIYCHNMSGTPKEFLTLPAGSKSNFVDDPEPGKFSGYTVYNKVKVMLDKNGMSVVQDDFTFAETRRGKNKTYGIASDCLRAYSTQGSMKIDLTGTPFYVDPTVTWVTHGYLPGKRQLQRSSNNQILSIRCGGHCGECVPDPQLRLLYDPNLAVPCGNQEVENQQRAERNLYSLFIP